ncbi:MAG: hypothetical protein ACREQA_22360 [Candidatus Binatia bacterium]
MFFGLKRSSMLLILGLLLPSATGCSSSITNRSEPQTVPEPKIFQSNVELNPSLKARVTKVLFFESGRSDVELRQKKRIYQSRFAQATARSVYTEIHLEHPQPGKRIDFIVTLVYIREDGTTFRIEEYQSRIEADWTSSSHWAGVGDYGPGYWHVGAYKVDVQINGGKVATGSFAIHE